MDKIVEKTGAPLKSSYVITREMSEKVYIIPPHRTRYLSEITENNRKYDDWVNRQVAIADKLYAIRKTIVSLKEKETPDQEIIKVLEAEFDRTKLDLDPKNWQLIEQWDEKVKRYSNPEYTYRVRDREVKVKTFTESLAHTKVPKVALPRYRGWGDLLRWMLQENVPGEFPFTAGIYPFKRQEEDPTRMFAGEGGPERTNRRFIISATRCPPSGSQLHSTRLRCTVATQIIVRISMAKSAIRECRYAAWMMPKNCTAALTWPIRKLLYR